MTSIKTLHDELGNDVTIAGHAAGPDGQSITLITFTTDNDLASTLKERLVATVAALPFLLAASFAPFIDAAPEAETTAEEPAEEAAADAATDGTEGEASTTDEDEEKPEPSVAYAVLVDGEVQTTFLVCETLKTSLPDDIDDKTADHSPLIFGLTADEIATPSDALLAALKLVNGAQEIVFLVPQAPKAEDVAEAAPDAETDTAPTTDEPEAAATTAEAEGEATTETEAADETTTETAEATEEGAGDADDSNEGEEGAKTFLSKLGETIYVDVTFEHEGATFYVCAVAFE